MVFVIRNNQQFGPYDEHTLLSYVNSGQILLCDKAKDANSTEETTVRILLKRNGFKAKVSHGGNLVAQLNKIGSELIIPKDSFQKKKWISDKTLLILAAIGLFPSVLSFMPIGGYLVFYLVSLYFAVIWGMFFFSFFKTPQVTIKTTVLVFFLTQFFVFLIWDILGIPALNPFMYMTKLGIPLSLIGFILGVGVSEELGKAIPVYIIARKAKEPLIPQTLVYYGLMSGIAFGVFEGVQYQTSVNVQLDYTSAFFMNIARLTSLPFLHAIWCGIAGYFIAFANLYPKYRISLYFLAIAIPATLHGVYDTFCGSILGMFIALPITFIGVILLMTYLKQGINYQSKLRN
ncbi:PrsW family glutamic-type intramembrane protease [Phocaeicola paurosaccharolyticus]|uniref:PrsW family glutamic-type intramembrane protease n=1 Tax=Phocaeicola paurosaccharolyticus TaxID=732242 RepID=UPI000468A5F5|nr:PrsW family glutamic-type intramembrane protease [Phocaeicola paurosaccharolyticus]